LIAFSALILVSQRKSYHAFSCHCFKVAAWHVVACPLMLDNPAVSLFVCCAVRAGLKKIPVKTEPDPVSEKVILRILAKWFSIRFFSFISQFFMKLIFSLLPVL
jgi:hypothetical protein